MPDSIDEKLVRLLGKNAQQSYEILAKKLGVSSATVRRRINKLVRNKLIQIVGAVDPIKFGCKFVVLIGLDVSHEYLESVTKALVKRPEIRFISYSTGRFDIIFVAWFRSNEQFTEFLTKVLAKIEGIKDSETFICLDVKKGLYHPFE